MTKPTPVPPALDVPQRDALVAKLDSIRPDGTSDRPLKQADVSAVLGLALERVGDAQTVIQAAIESATDRMLAEVDATRALARSLAPLPPPAPSGER